jgi:hypothetical protein
MLKPFLLFLCIISFFKIQAQDEIPEMGFYSEAERTLSKCEFDKDAEAVVLLDYAFSDHDDEYHLITIRRVRIKILSDKGIDRGNISIPFYSKDKFEFLHTIQGLTYNWNNDGQFESFKLDKNQIFTEKVDDRFSIVKFAMPGVKKGSIIEYTYTSMMEHYGGLRDWIFQSNIPTIKSAYRLVVLPRAEFKYVVTKKDEYPIIVKQDNDRGSVYFEMNNVAGLQSEPFMNAANDYLQRVEFQLSGYRSVSGSMVTMSDTWVKIARELDDEPALGGAIKKDLPGTDALALVISGETTETGKLKKLYQYVQSTYTWNEINTKYTSEPLKKIVERKTGTSGELNLVLTNLLRIFNIEASPMLAAERSFGNVNPNLPLIDRFNKTVVFAIADGKPYILDVTQKHSPYYLVPYPLLNTYALIINKKTKELVLIKAGAQLYNSVITVSSKMDANGVMEGHVNIKNLQFAIPYYETRVKYGIKDLVKEFSELDEKEFGLKDYNSATKNGTSDTLIYDFNYKKDFSDGSNFILLKCNLFTGISKNPFTRDIRFTDINFGYPLKIMLQHEIVLPEGFKTDLPEDKMVFTPESDITAVRNVTRNGNTITVTINFSRNTTFYPAAKYNTLKKFYAEMLTLLEEPITIKIK